MRLTDTGRTIIDQATADLLAAEAALLDGLTEQDRSALSELLAKLSVLLEDAEATAG